MTQSDAVGSRLAPRFGLGGLGLALVLSEVLAGGVAAAQIRLAEAYPLEGRSTVIELLDGDVPVAGATVAVLYRPNSEAATLEMLGTTDARGRIAWVPSNAGLAQVTARVPSGGEALGIDVAIRWSRIPAAGLVILVIAAVLLFGGAALGFHLLVRGAPPPST